MTPIQETIYDFVCGQGSFYGYLLMRMEIRIDNSFPTLYTTYANNNIALGYNEKYFLSLTRPERMAVIEHEILHVANNHHGQFQEERLRGQCSDKAYLIGMDCAINQLIENLPKEGVTLPLVQKMLNNTTIEQKREARYYVELLKQKDIKDNLNFWCKFLSSPHQNREINNLLQATMEELLKEVSQTQSNIPEGIQMVLDQITKNSVLDWKQLLKIACCKTEKTDKRSSWGRLRRRSPFENIKGRVFNYRPRIVVAIDTSGSIYSNPKILEEFTGQLKQIRECVGGKFTIIECDDGIQNVFELNKTTKIKTSYSGGGGTDFRPVFDLCNQKLKPGLLVYLTDGEGSFPSQEPCFSTLWCSVLDNKTKFPFGRYIKIDIK